MKDANKNRCQDRARKRAKGDARCALRKLDTLPIIEGWAEEPDLERAYEILEMIAQDLGIEVKGDDDNA